MIVPHGIFLTSSPAKFSVCVGCNIAHALLLMCWQLCMVGLRESCEGRNMRRTFYERVAAESGVRTKHQHTPRGSLCVRNDGCAPAVLLLPPSRQRPRALGRRRRQHTCRQRSSGRRPGRSGRRRRSGPHSPGCWRCPCVPGSACRRPSRRRPSGRRHRPNRAGRG